MADLLVQIQPWPKRKPPLKPCCFLCRGLIDEAPTACLLCEPMEGQEHPRPWAMLCPTCEGLGPELEPALRSKFLRAAATFERFVPGEKQELLDGARMWKDLAAGCIDVQLSPIEGMEERE